MLEKVETQSDRCQCGGKQFQNVASLAVAGRKYRSVVTAGVETHSLNYVENLFGKHSATKPLITSLTDLIIKQCRVGPCSGGIFRQTLLKHRPTACFIHPTSLALTFFKLYCLCIAIHAWHQLPINPLSTEIHLSLRVGADFAFIDSEQTIFSLSALTKPDRNWQHLLFFLMEDVGCQRGWGKK